MFTLTQTRGRVCVRVYRGPDLCNHIRGDDDNASCAHAHCAALGCAAGEDAWRRRRVINMVCGSLGLRAQRAMDCSIRAVSMNIMYNMLAFRFIVLLDNHFFNRNRGRHRVAIKKYLFVLPRIDTQKHVDVECWIVYWRRDSKSNFNFFSQGHLWGNLLLWARVSDLVLRIECRMFQPCFILLKRLTHLVGCC